MTMSANITVQRSEAPTERVPHGKNLSGAERWVSVIGGGTLAIYGLSDLALGGALWAGVGGYMLYRGFTGYCPLYGRLGISSRSPHPTQWRVRAEEVVPGSPDEVYRWYRNPENLPRATKYVREVQVGPEQRTHWRLGLPGGREIQWTSETTEDRPGSRIAWRTLPGGDLDCEGETFFEPAAADGQRTNLRVLLNCHPRALKVRGLLTKAAELAGEAITQAMVKRELTNVREHLEDLTIAHEAAPVTQPPQPAEPVIPSMH